MSGKRIEKIYINRIAYGILCLIIGFLFVFYLDAITFTLLFSFFALPVVSYILCKNSLSKIKGQISFSSKQITQGEEVKLHIGIDNLGFMPVANVKAKVLVWNCFAGEKEEYEVSLHAKSYKESEVVLKISSKSCALIKAEFVSLYMYDYLGMYKTKVKEVADETLVYVFPEKRNYELQNVYGKEQEEEANNVIGEDTSEIVDVRPFRRGDKLNRIHWKLTLKCDETMVKEFGDVYGNRFTIGFELCQNTDYEILDDILVLLYEVGKRLVSDNREFVVKWYDGYKNVFMEKEIDSVVGLDKVYKEVLESSTTAADDILYSHEKEENNRHFVYITAKDNIPNCEGEVMGGPYGKAVLLWI